MRILSGFVALAIFVFAQLNAASAEIRTEEIEYRDGDTVLTGVLAWDDAVSGPRPAILVVHEWWGLNDYARARAINLAGEGFVAFALDMYGEGKVTTHPDQAGEWANQIASNRELWLRRANLGLETLMAQPQVADGEVAAIGYCFGGSTVMQMAYANSPVKAVVSFHGSLPPASEDVTSISPRVLIAHGRDDQFIPAERITAFQDALDRAGADWEMTIYSGARHGFTNPNASDYGIDNVKYHEVADERSWAAMLGLFEDIF